MSTAKELSFSGRWRNPEKKRPMSLLVSGAISAPLCCLAGAHSFMIRRFQHKVTITLYTQCLHEIYWLSARLVKIWLPNIKGILCYAYPKFSREDILLAFIRRYLLSERIVLRSIPETVLRLFRSFPGVFCIGYLSCSEPAKQRKT